MDEPHLRCARCGHTYREADNGDAACGFHTGRLRDYDQLAEPGRGSPGDFWECCMRQVQDDLPALDVPGCATGRHVEADVDDPGPVRREIEWQNRVVRHVLGRNGVASAEEIARAQERIKRFLSGATEDATYAERRGWMDTRLIEWTDFPWLAQQLAEPANAADRRQRVAGFVTGKENVERLRRETGLGRP